MSPTVLRVSRKRDPDSFVAMRPTQGIVRLSPALVIWIVACSSGSSSGSDGSVSADQACSDFASAGCQKLSSCAAFLIDDVYGDVATCTTRLKASCGNAL